MKARELSVPQCFNPSGWGEYREENTRHCYSLGGLTLGIIASELDVSPPFPGPQVSNMKSGGLTKRAASSHPVAGTQSPIGRLYTPACQGNKGT